MTPVGVEVEPAWRGGWDGAGLGLLVPPELVFVSSAVAPEDAGLCRDLEDPLELDSLVPDAEPVPGQDPKSQHFVFQLVAVSV